MEWETDWNLRLRMFLTLVLIVLLPFGFMYSLMWILNDVVPYLSQALMGTRLGTGFRISTRFLIVLVLVGLGLQYLFGDKIALRSVNAKKVDAQEYPDLHATVGRLAQQADLPKPDVAVSSTKVPNAFAMGRSPRSSTVVVTEGLLDTLKDEEIQAVIAHELAHIKNRDVSIMTVAYLLPTVTYIVAIVAYKVLTGIWHVLEGLRHSDGDDARAIVAVIVIFVVTSILTLAVSTFFWVGSFLMFRLMSRYREHVADRGAAKITGKPSKLATALRKIDDEITSIPDEDLRKQDGGVEALYIAPLDHEKFAEDHALVSRDMFPATHPPTKERIENLEEMVGDV